MNKGSVPMTPLTAMSSEGLGSTLGSDRAVKVAKSRRHDSSNQLYFAQ